MIQAVVFDFDGLILDTETNEYHSFVDLYRHFGAELPLEVWAKVIGTDPSAFFNPYDYLETCLGKPIDRDFCRQMRRQRYAERMESELLRPGVISVLEQAQRLGLAIGLASSSTREWIEGYLQQYGIGDYFSCVRTRDDVKQVKPDPELYTQAVERLGVKPAEAIAFEDSPNGALAAHRAGLRPVIVPNPLTESLPFGPHSKRLDTLEGLDLQLLISELADEREKLA
ncbi:MAG: phosphoglycolate phosphatase [Paenibacillus sp.]|nr:phosphoglycolate phosphatase [Paenibacillus sp.]